MKKYISCQAALVLLAGFLNAQVSYYHSVNVAQQPFSINKAIAVNSGFFCAGVCNNLFAVMKTDSNGLPAWVETSGTGSVSDFAYSKTGDILTCGSISQRFVVIDFQQNGNISWQYNFKDSLQTSNASSIIQLADSSVVAEGYNRNRVVFIRLSSTGSPVFTISPDAGIIPGKLLASNDGGFVSLNANAPQIPDSLSFTLSHFDSSGNLLWAKQYASHDSINIAAFTTTADGGFAMAGTAMDIINGNQTKSSMLARFDSAGNVLWFRYYFDSLSQFNAGLSSLAQTPDGGFIACGTVTKGLSDDGIISFKTDSSGNFLWAKRYTNARQTSGAGAAAYKNGYLFFGTEQEPENAAQNVIIIRTDSSALSGCAATALSFATSSGSLDTTGWFYSDTNVVLSGMLNYLTYSLPSTLNTTCPHLPYSRYYPLLDTTNIWHYALNYITEVRPSDGNNAKSLINTCDYPLNNNFDGNENYDYTGSDTIFSGIAYKQIWQYNLNNPCMIGYIREDTLQRRVYFRSVIGTETLLYDFSIFPGDSVYIQYYDPWLSGWFVLDSVETISTISGNRREFYLHCGTCSNNPAPLLWVESAGSLYRSVYSYMPGYGYQNFGGPFSQAAYCAHNSGSSLASQYNFYQFLSCFAHKQLVYFDSCAFELAHQNPQCYSIQDSCDYGNGCGAIKEVSYLSSFNVYPNPASEKVTLSLQVNQTSCFEIEVMDEQGRKVLPVLHLGQLNTGSQNRVMDISGLSSGFYLIACKNQDGAVYRKMMINH